MKIIMECYKNTHTDSQTIRKVYVKAIIKNETLNKSYHAGINKNLC